MSIPIKSENDLKLIRRGGQILAKILAEVRTASMPGKTTSELDSLARRLCLKYGVKPSFLGYGGYPAALCVSMNNEVVHGLPGSSVLTEGDLISLDMGVLYEGFHTDSAMTFICNKSNNTPDEQLISATEASFWAAVDCIKAGVKLSDVSAKIQQVAESSGFGVVRVLVGHGIGREVHEEPHVPNYAHSGNNIHLKSGMVLAIEPMLIADGTVDVYLSDDNWTYLTKSGAKAAHYEHTVIVTDTGCEVATAL